MHSPTHGGNASEPTDGPAAPATPGIAADTAHGIDCLGVQDEARAFARILASRRTGTPLSIGLFGDWGSGKSFFLALLQAQIEARCAAFDRSAITLAEDAPALQTLRERWHGGIAQITFNAWHYAEPNLWASLVTRVFDELATIVNPTESPRDTRTRLLAEVSRGKQRRAEAEYEVGQATKALTHAIADRDAHQAQLDELREELAVVEAVDPRAQSDQDAALEVGSPVGALRVTLRWVWSRGRWTRIGLVTSVVLLALGGVLGLGHALGWFDLSAGIALASAIAGVLTGLGSTLAAWWTFIEPKLIKARIAYKAITAGRDQAQRFVDDAARDLLGTQTDALAITRVRLEGAEVGLENAQLSARQAADQLAGARREIQQLDAGRRFYAFVRDREDSDEYRKHLGLVSQIREDFAQLESILARIHAEGTELGDRPAISRIVLYIDDLDRCEPERVVEVLQAVHLLLASKIFVVVVAVDVRWLRRSLTLHYDRLLQTDGETHDDEGRPTPKNYLEKIFQIPFSLRPMGSEGFSALVDDTLHIAEPGDEPSVSPHAVPGAELTSDRVVALHETEVEFLKGLHGVIDTPRLAKALVNTYRLLRAEIAPEDLGPYLSEQSYRGVLTLLAIQIGRSEEALALFEQMRTSPRKSSTLGALLGELSQGTGERWVELREAVAHVGTDTLVVDPLVDWLPRIRRFSFTPWPTH